MKTKTFLRLILGLIITINFANAGELLLEPSKGSYSPGCTLGIDIIMDPEGESISATDIVMESSMKFIKFEPTEVFPYFFPPKISDSTVHIVGFTSGPSQRIKEKGIIGKVFFKPLDKSDRDGTIRFYIKNKGDTTDTNLSIGGGVDVLEDTRNGFYKFDGTQCDYPDPDELPMPEIKTIEEIEEKIDGDHKATIYRESWQENKSYVISLFILIVILIVYIRFFKGKSKKQ